MSPQSKFECKGKMISYEDYYKSAYGVTIKDYKQPLVKVLSNVKKFIGKDQAINE